VHLLEKLTPGARAWECPNDQKATVHQDRELGDCGNVLSAFHAKLSFRICYDT
jgi:hypothetical protein